MLKIIISPAKKMNVTEEFPCSPTVPAMAEDALRLHKRLEQMSLAELTALWGCSDRLAARNYEHLHTYAPDHGRTPALLSYEGIQYQHIGASVFTDTQWDYVNDHLRILSGFYGILRPTDLVIPYRLEMQARLSTDRGADLYSYWGDALCRALLAEGMTALVNLASGEYSRSVLPHLHREQVSCITCIFGQLSQGRVKMKGTQAKIARGEMVRWMAEEGIEKAEDIREFRQLGYEFRSDLSTEDEYIFLLPHAD